MRTEQWKHYATTGDEIFTFDWAFAPRLSAVYDVRGDGRHKASAYWGRYYDPIRNDMTNFAGTLTGSILEEQVYALGEYVTYRTRGGPTVQDAFFSPETKTPYTDELQLGYAVDLGYGMSFDALYFNRRTRDIFEDYDLHLYADPTGYASVSGVPGDPNAPDSLFLGYDYFGYTENPGSNFVLGTLDGGKRNFQGLEFVFRKRFANNWQFLTSYNWNDAEGNSNSDGNADFQGDVLFLDPRAPNQFGTQPGLIRHLVKGGGSYTLPLRPAAGRDRVVELGHGRQPHLPVVEPQPAAARADRRGLPVRRRRRPLAGARLRRVAQQPRVGPDRPAGPVRPEHRPGGRRGVRRHVQRPRHPGRGPQSGPGRRAGRRRVRQRPDVRPAAPRVPRRCACASSSESRDRTPPAGPAVRRRPRFLYGRRIPSLPQHTAATCV